MRLEIGILPTDFSKLTYFGKDGGGNQQPGASENNSSSEKKEPKKTTPRPVTPITEEHAGDEGGSFGQASSL